MDTIDTPLGSQMSRRAVLIGGAALGAAGAATVLTRGQPAAAQALRPAIPVPHGSARVGGTFDLFPFKKGTTYIEAVNDWNARTGTQMRCWKVYFQESKFPAVLTDELKAIKHFGIQALVSFKPVPPTGTNQKQVKADSTHLENALKLFKANKLDAEICLWQEIGPRDMTATEYHALVKHYGPIVRAFYPLVWNAPGYPPPSVWEPYGKPILGEFNGGLALDLYCNDYVKHGRSLKQILELAGDKPVGVWEIGNTNTAKFEPSSTQLKKYMKYLQNTLVARLASGLPVGSVAWYDGPADPSQAGGNEIVGTHPCPDAALDITLYRQLYDAVNQVSQA
jgi:hypothetical protein